MINLSLIVAHDKNGLIGKDNGLPWSLPEDLKHFRKHTIGKTVVMGFNTYLSLGKPLKDRHNIVLTRKDIELEGFEVVHSIEDILNRAEIEEIVIIGGKQIYEQFNQHVSIMYVTEIENVFTGDTVLKLDLSEFEEISKEEGLRNEKNDELYYFVEYKRK